MIVVAAAVFGIVFYAVWCAGIFAELLIGGGVGTWLYKQTNVKDEPDCSAPLCAADACRPVAARWRCSGRSAG